MAQPGGTLNKAIEHHRAGRFDQAIPLYRTAIRFGDPTPQVHRMLADALWGSGQIDAAVESLRMAVRSWPQDRGARSALAASLVAIGRHAEAVQVRRESVVMSPAGPAAVVARLELAEQLLAAHRTEEALGAVDSVLTLDTNCVPALAERTQLLERLGKGPEAAAAAAALAAVAPDHPISAIMRARSASQSGDTAGATAVLRRAIDAAPRERRAVLLLELSKELDKRGDFAGAFAAATEAHSARESAGSAAAADPHLTAIERCISDISAGSVGAWQAAGAVSPEAPPIFVVGFPRSGTTLAEQMLSAHPRLVVTDEAPLLQGVREEMFARFQPKGRFPADLGAFTPQQISRGREWYFRRAAELLGPASARRIVDKNPLNVPDLCTARLLFPASPVVFVQRDPRDACLSCYLQGFSRGVRLLRSLDGVCTFFGAMQRLREHYARVLGQTVFELRYEDLVAEPDATARRLIDFIGEPWDDGVLRFFEARHARYITTPSYRDVRSPVHARAVGRWRHYRAQLQTVLPQLTDWATRLGYAAD